MKIGKKKKKKKNGARACLVKKVCVFFMAVWANMWRSLHVNTIRISTDRETYYYSTDDLAILTCQTSTGGCWWCVHFKPPGEWRIRFNTSSSRVEKLKKSIRLKFRMCGHTIQKKRETFLSDRRSNRRFRWHVVLIFSMEHFRNNCFRDPLYLFEGSEFNFTSLSHANCLLNVFGQQVQYCCPKSGPHAKYVESGG